MRKVRRVSGRVGDPKLQVIPNARPRTTPLEVVLAEYVEHQNSHRPHRSLSQRAPAASEAILPYPGDVDLTRLQTTDRLGGLIHEYRLVA